MSEEIQEYVPHEYFTILHISLSVHWFSVLSVCIATIYVFTLSWGVDGRRMNSGGDFH
jgi:hypothetical protein